ARAFSRLRLATARISPFAVSRTAGMKEMRAMLAVPKMPQRTLVVLAMAMPPFLSAVIPPRADFTFSRGGPGGSCLPWWKRSCDIFEESGRSNDARSSKDLAGTGAEHRRPAGPAGDGHAFGGPPRPCF